MSAQWHYKHGGEQHGPVSAVELKQLADSGNLSPTDLLWKEGMSKWVPAQKVKGLFGSTTARETFSANKAPPVPVTQAPKPTEAPVQPRAPAAPRFHYLVGGKPFGPLTLAQMQKRVESGQLKRTEVVWVEGTPQWVAASTIADLQFPVTIPPVVTAPAPSEVIPVVLPVKPAKVTPVVEPYRNQRFKEDIPIIFDAVADGNLAEVKSRLDSDPELIRLKMNRLGYTPLHVAAWYGCGRVAAFLLSRGAGANDRNDDGNTPLHVLGDFDKMENGGPAAVVKVLVNHGADINAQDQNGKTPLHRATACSSDLVELLLSYGADPGARGEAGWTPLHEAALGPHHSDCVQNTKRVIRRLLRAGADINAKTVDGERPLIAALLALQKAEDSGHDSSICAAQEVVELLRQNGATADLGMTKADIAMMLVLWSLCCSPLVLPGILLGVLAIYELRHGGRGRGKAILAVLIGTFLLVGFLSIVVYNSVMVGHPARR